MTNQATLYGDDEIQRIQGQSYRTGNLAGQERALKDVLKYVQEELGKHLSLTPEGWRIPESVHKVVLAAVSKRVQDELTATEREAERHRNSIR